MFIVGIAVEAVVVGEVVGAHGQGAQPGVVGQGKRERRRLVGFLSLLVDEVAHPPEVRGVGLKRGGDGAFEGEGSVGVEQLDESAGEDAEVVVAFGGGGEQGFRRRGGVMEAVGGAVCTGESFLALKCLDVSGVFDLLSTVERARMGSEHDAGVEDAHGLEGGRDDEGASHVAVRNRIIVCIESRVGGLSHLDFDALFAGEGIVGQCEQMGALFGEDVGDGAPAVLGAGTFGGAGVAPLVGLVIEVVDVVEVAGVEEALADKSDNPFDSPLLISSRGRDGARLEAIMGGQFKQRGMEADGAGSVRARRFSCCRRARFWSHPRAHGTLRRGRG